MDTTVTGGTADVATLCGDARFRNATVQLLMREYSPAVVLLNRREHVLTRFVLRTSKTHEKDQRDLVTSRIRLFSACVVPATVHVKV